MGDFGSLPLQKFPIFVYILTFFTKSDVVLDKMVVWFISFAIFVPFMFLQYLPKFPQRFVPFVLHIFKSIFNCNQKLFHVSSSKLFSCLSLINTFFVSTYVQFNHFEFLSQIFNLVSSYLYVLINNMHHFMRKFSLNTLICDMCPFSSKLCLNALIGDS